MSLAAFLIGQRIEDRIRLEGHGRLFALTDTQKAIPGLSGILRIVGGATAGKFDEIECRTDRRSCAGRE
jgi:hypothetical protein